jgi:hypothetical protein
MNALSDEEKGTPPKKLLDKDLATMKSYDDLLKN